jgi:histidinol-phosphate/aromatic aminotransferase/cobyric acid decarboxylase-like protein
MKTVKYQVRVNLDDERERMFARMSAIPGITLRPSMGEYIFFTVGEPERVHRALLNRRQSVRDVSKYSRFPSTLRVRVGDPDENEAFLQALGEVMG